MGDGPMRFDGLETDVSRQQWVEDMDVDVSGAWAGHWLALPAQLGTGCCCTKECNKQCLSAGACPPALNMLQENPHPSELRTPKKDKVVSKRQSIHGVVMGAGDRR